MNKVTHAQNIIAPISDYFLTQRVKSSQEDYTDRLVKHHTVIVAAMKAKQNADMGAAIQHGVRGFKVDANVGITGIIQRLLDDSDEGDALEI